MMPFYNNFSFLSTLYDYFSVWLGILCNKKKHPSVTSGAFFNGLGSRLVLLPAFYFRPNLIVEWQGITHIVNAMAVFDIFGGRIGDRRVHVRVVQVFVIGFGKIQCGLVRVGVREVA